MLWYVKVGFKIKTRMKDTGIVTSYMWVETASQICFIIEAIFFFCGLLRFSRIKRRDFEAKDPY